MPEYRIREAAELLGVSDDTLRRWADSGRVATTVDDGRTPGGRGDGTGAARGGARGRRGARGPPVVVAHSVRNRFAGLVTRVVRDTVMAQVEIQAGPHRFVSLLSREAADELGLEPGVLAVAAVKSTNVVRRDPASPLSEPAPCAEPPSPLACLGLPRPSRRRLRLAQQRSGRARPRRRRRRPTAVTGSDHGVRGGVADRGVHDDRQAVRGREPRHQGDVQLRRELGAGRPRSRRAHRPTSSRPRAPKNMQQVVDAGRRRQPHRLRQERDGDRRPADQPGAT